MTDEQEPTLLMFQKIIAVNRYGAASFKWSEILISSLVTHEWCQISDNRRLHSISIVLESIRAISVLDS